VTCAAIAKFYEDLGRDSDEEPGTGTQSEDGRRGGRTGVKNEDEGGGRDSQKYLPRTRSVILSVTG